VALIKQMDIEIYHAIPNPHPIKDSLQTLPGAGSVKVILHSNDGVSGTGTVSFGRISGAPSALAAVLEHELKQLVLYTDPAMVKATHAFMLRELEYHGASGLCMFGIAAVDTALWDCWGKSLGVPCWKLWGGVRESIPAYAMVGWLNYDDDEVVSICRKAVNQGFKAVKVKVGYPTLAEDIRRVSLVQDALGPDIRVMVDANQSLNVAEAIRRGRAFQELGCYWWEEPIPAHDLDGYTHLVQSLDIPIATGENLYTHQDFTRFMKHNAVDIVQPDLRRSGGPTAMLQIGLTAQGFGIPYASHGGGPVQLNVMACLQNAIYLETGLMDPDSPLQMQDGCVQIPQGPGFSWQ
jgi:L-alanine-DL-glutamate epimerase-like enolase superfamily enzyme